MELAADLQRKIELILGRNVLPSEQGNADSFFSFIKSDVADFRALEQKGGVLAISYIRYRLKSGVALNRAVSYYGCVIQQGMPLEEWIKD